MPTLCKMRHLKSISPLYYSLLRLIGSLPQWSWTACVWFSSPCSPSSPPWQPSPWRPTCSSGEHEQKMEEQFKLIGQLFYFVKYAQNAYMNHLVLLKINISLCFVCILQTHRSSTKLSKSLCHKKLVSALWTNTKWYQHWLRAGLIVTKGRTNKVNGLD